jgi:hypothetical protein
LGPAQCYSTDRVGFRPRQSLPTARCSDICRHSSPSRCQFPTAPGYHVTLHAPHRPREMRCRPYPLAAWLHRALCYRRVHRRSSALRDAAPQAGHRVARRPVNRHHRPLLRLPSARAAASASTCTTASGLSPAQPPPREVLTDAPPLYGSSTIAIDLWATLSPLSLPARPSTP